MSKNIINIKAESFPWQIKLIGILFLIVAISVLANFWWLSLILAVLSLLILTGHSGTEINVSDKTFREYNSYLSIRRGDRLKYDEIERIFINSAKVSQKMYTAHTLNSSTFHSVVYNAYLKLDGRKIFLTGRKDKAQLIRILKPVASALRTEITDNTI